MGFEDMGMCYNTSCGLEDTEENKECTKHNPLIEHARFRVRVLLGGDDAAAVAEERLAECGDDAFTIRPMHQEDGLGFRNAGHDLRPCQIASQA